MILVIHEVPIVNLTLLGSQHAKTLLTVLHIQETIENALLSFLALLLGQSSYGVSLGGWQGVKWRQRGSHCVNARTTCRIHVVDTFASGRLRLHRALCVQPQDVTRQITELSSLLKLLFQLTSSSRQQEYTTIFRDTLANTLGETLAQLRVQLDSITWWTAKRDV